MSIIRWKPFGELEDLMKDLSFNTFQLKTCDLAVDISEDEKNVFIEMHIPGIEPDKIDIEIEDNHLHISGSRVEEQKSEDRTYYHREIKRGSFERVISLPCTVDAQHVRAEQKNGTLRVVLPKTEQTKRSKITVNKV
jgi:HSP20 family protein